MCQDLGWLVNFRKIRTGAQTSLRFCRLPVNSGVRSGPTYTGLVAEPSRVMEGDMRSGPLCALLWRSLTWCCNKQVTLKAIFHAG